MQSSMLRCACESDHDSSTSGHCCSILLQRSATSMHGLCCRRRHQALARKAVASETSCECCLLTHTSSAQPLGATDLPQGLCLEVCTISQYICNTEPCVISYAAINMELTCILSRARDQSDAQSTLCFRLCVRTRESAQFLAGNEWLRGKQCAPCWEPCGCPHLTVHRSACMHAASIPTWVHLSLVSTTLSTEQCAPHSAPPLTTPLGGRAAASCSKATVGLSSDGSEWRQGEMEGYKFSVNPKADLCKLINVSLRCALKSSFKYSVSCV